MPDHRKIVGDENQRQLENLLQLLQQMKERYTRDPEAAAALLKTGEIPRDSALNPVEVAAWSQLATTLMASDAAILLY